MKKKIYLLLTSLLFGGLVMFARVQINLSYALLDPSPVLPGLGKDPVLVPQVWLDDHEITFSSIHPTFTLLLLEDDVVFSLDVPSTASSVVLPLWLSGEYEIVLRPSGCSYYFYGYIEL